MIIKQQMRITVYKPSEFEVTIGTFNNHDQESYSLQFMDCNVPGLKEKHYCYLDINFSSPDRRYYRIDEKEDYIGHIALQENDGEKSIHIKLDLDLKYFQVFKTQIDYPVFFMLIIKKEQVPEQDKENNAIEMYKIERFSLKSIVQEEPIPQKKGWF